MVKSYVFDRFFSALFQVYLLIVRINYNFSITVFQIM